MFALRIRMLGLVCLAGLLVIWARVAYLGLALGPWHRVTLAEADVRLRAIPAPRGTIRTGDGMVLAEDRCDADLVVHYRYLERPLDEEWLTREAMSRIARRDRRDPTKLNRARESLRSEIRAMWEDLAALTGVQASELDRRAAIVQRRIERIVESVNRRRRERWEEEQRRLPASAQLPLESNDGPVQGSAQPATAPSLIRRLCDWLSEESPRSSREPVPVTVVEQNRYYTLVENVSSEVILEFAAHAERFPGVRLDQQIRRLYPQGSFACGVIGFTEPETGAGRSDGDDEINSGSGVTGIEGAYDGHLRGTPGYIRERFSRAGSSSRRVLGGKPPETGQELILTIDPRLQSFAEAVLEQATGRRFGEGDKASSGACVVLDVLTGSVTVAASAPRFDLNIAAQPASDAAQELATRPDAPLFNRVVQMCLPPGSTFKPITALAGLECGVDPNQPFQCQGYLRDPDRFRCLIYRRFGVGHDVVNMTDALVRSCNVYFFSLAERVGVEGIVRWAEAFGFGRVTGIDLAGEEPGVVAALGRAARSSSPRAPGDGEAKGLAIGQGAFAATPIQVAVMMAAIANGGQRVVPHVRRDAFQPPRPIEGIEGRTVRSLERLRDALRLVVADPRGTGHEHVFLAEVEIAGKTGTAQSGSPLGDHAWFAGYAPADRPRYAIAVALEHAGSGGQAAGPVARSLIRHMFELGYFSDGAIR